MAEIPNVNKKFNKETGLAKTGEMAPTENHATEILPKTSEAL